MRTERKQKAGIEDLWPSKSGDEIGHENCEPALPKGVLGLATRKQIARILQISVGTVDRWRREGIIPHFFIPGGTKKSKGVVRFKIDEVMEALGRFRVGIREEVSIKH